MKKTLFFVILLLSFIGLTAEQIVVSQYPDDIRLINSNPNNMELEFTLGSFYREPVTINGDSWYHLFLKKEGITLEAGMPQVPVLARSLIIPATAKMHLNITNSEYVELTLPVAPSKGNLTRDIDPATIPYTFADFYQSGESYPAEIAYLTEPFILRDYRGITVRFQPFIYYPATQTLRVYTKLNISIYAQGTDLTNALLNPKTSYSRYFESTYQNMFLNFSAAKYPSLDEEGRILVIKHNMFDATIQPWVDWKRQLGFTVDVVDVTQAGSTAANIKTYIQNQYDLNNGLMFVQLVGDAPQVPTLTYAGGGSDPSYALLAGNDNYYDIFVGRFSAQTVAELETQVTRSIYYERDIAPGATWLEKAIGIASAEGGGGQGDMGESDITHMNNIRTDLLNYGYTTIDQIYDPGATAAQVSNSVNQGRGFINYCGHGADTYWVTTNFNNNNANALTNDYMLPLIVSVACVNGNFVSQTCFAEAWMRSVNETTNAPAGAITFWGSTINQSWAPPMRGQDEVTDLLVGNLKYRVGGLLFNGAHKMIEVYGSQGLADARTWTIFGDASLMVRTKNPQVITATFNPVLFLGMSSFAVQTIPGGRITLTNNGIIYGKGIADATGNCVINLDIIPDLPMDMTLTISAFDYQTYIQTIQVLPSSGPYLVVEETTFSDVNDNIFTTGETVFLDMNLSNIGSETATSVSVTLSTNDSYVTLLNPTLTIGDIDSGNVSSTGTFQIQLSNSIPDEHTVNLHIFIATSDGETFENNCSFIAYAPAITWGPLQINDSLGNNNGRIDAGENVTITFNVTNSGHCDAADISTTLIVNGVSHLITPIISTIENLPVSQTGQMIYNVTFSSQIPMGTSVQLTAMTMFGEYLSVHTYTIVVGIVMENFDFGFSNFPWVFEGGNWTISPDSFNGSMAAKSPSINNNSSTSISITYQCPQAGEISFWKKVSSEPSCDFLKFYINGILKFQWSGTDDFWSQVTYPVSPGTNVFKWEYVKNNGSYQGSDCAWLDDIIFPSTGEQIGIPVFVIDMDDINFGEVIVNTIVSQTVTICNCGTASMLGTIATESPFSLGEPSMPAYYLEYIIPVGESFTFNVNFQPLQNSVYTGTLIINSDDPNALVNTIPLYGTGQPVANDDPVAVLVTSLKGCYPNPFNPTTTISFSIKEKTPVELIIYNILGQKVRTLVNQPLEPGEHSIVWNGTDNKGRSVASGIYFYRMKAGNYSETKKMVLKK
ncbi:MAG TPA: C25 family cysteine peptidase [Candidatus Cloacimonas acidaminovorans]|nr:C25 family cysteine peptidase [Candidatus Cloacimonas acidaminovorans]HRS60246.1 C25 family cysteine peptidase [Candidatus Cloacimonas sp.]